MVTLPTVAPLSGATEYLKRNYTHLAGIHLALTTRSSWRILDGVPHVPHCESARDKQGNLQGEFQSLPLQEVWGKTCWTCPDVLDYLLGPEAGKVAALAIQTHQAHTLPQDRHLVAVALALHKACGDTLAYDRGKPEDERAFAFDPCMRVAEHLENVVEEDLRSDPLRHLHEYAAREIVRVPQVEHSPARNQQDRMRFGATSAVRRTWAMTTLDPRMEGRTRFLGTRWGKEGASGLYEDILHELDNQHEGLLNDKETVLVAFMADWRGYLSTVEIQLLEQIGEIKERWMYVPVTLTLWRYLREKFEGHAYCLGTPQASDTPEILETARVLIRDATSGSDLEEDGSVLRAARLLNP